MRTPSLEGLHQLLFAELTVAILIESLEESMKRIFVHVGWLLHQQKQASRESLEFPPAFPREKPLTYLVVVRSLVEEGHELVLHARGRKTLHVSTVYEVVLSKARIHSLRGNHVRNQPSGCRPCRIS